MSLSASFRECGSRLLLSLRVETPLPITGLAFKYTLTGCAVDRDVELLMTSPAVIPPGYTCSTINGQVRKGTGILAPGAPILALSDGGRQRGGAAPFSIGYTKESPITSGDVVHLVLLRQGETCTFEATNVTVACLQANGVLKDVPAADVRASFTHVRALEVFDSVQTETTSTATTTSSATTTTLPATTTTSSDTTSSDTTSSDTAPPASTSFLAAVAVGSFVGGVGVGFFLNMRKRND